MNIISESIEKIIKRISDIIFSTIFIVLLSPLFVIIGILIYIEDGKAIFFTQKRIGLYGKIFYMYKFRSMRINTEHKSTGYYTYKGDKRITKVGLYLRRSSLDELPQLINILRGEMSFVGPRPAIFDEFKFEKIIPENKPLILKRSLLKPGLTGLAQVKARNDIDWNEKLKYDSIYVEMQPTKRLISDIFIIFQTIISVFSSKGVYDKTK